MSEILPDFFMSEILPDFMSEILPDFQIKTMFISRRSITKQNKLIMYGLQQVGRACYGNLKNFIF